MLSKLWPFVVGAVSFGLDAYVLAGLLPAIAGSFEVPEALVGLGVTAFTGAYAISGPALAGVAGKFATKSVLIFALAAFTVGNILTMFSTSIVVFLIARIIAGVGAGVFSPVSSAAASLLVRPEQKGRALALVLSGMSIGTVVGVPLGLLISRYASWQWTIGLVSVLGILSLLGLVFRAQELPKVVSVGWRERLLAMAKLRNSVTISITFLCGVGSLGLYTYLAPLLASVHFESSTTVLIWVWGIGGAVGALSIGHIVDHFKAPLVITAIILATLTAALGVLAFSGSVLLTGIAVFAWGTLGWASVTPQQHTLLTSNPEHGLTAVAANSSANYLGSAVGAFLGSMLLATGVSGSGLALAAAGVIALAFALQIFRMGLNRTSLVS